MAPKSGKSGKAAKQSKINKPKQNSMRDKSKYFTDQGKDLKRMKRALNKYSNRNCSSNSSYVKLPRSPPMTKETRLSTNDVKPALLNKGRKRLCREFYDTPTEELAVALLGKLLCRVTAQGERLCGRIVETEAYLGKIDPACHSYQGRRTERNEPTYGPPGTAYVYFIYGMYHCFNISSKEEGACVLVRALEPVEGLDCMLQLRSQLRSAKRRATSKLLRDHELCNGPSKLCTAMDICKAKLNNADLVTSEVFWLEGAENADPLSVVCTTRIGIESYGKESQLKPYRYYILGNKNISVRDKNAENQFSVTTHVTKM